MKNCCIKERKKFSKRSIFVLLGSLLLIVSVITSTLTWLTTKDQKVNQFTVGSFSNPDVPDPDNPGQTISLDGYIYEELWDANTDGHKLAPGQTTIKDPKVGIGKGSEDAYVYIYIDNEYNEDVYFVLDESWEAVAGEATAKADVERGYCSGLFRYTEVLDASEADDWTTKIFTKVITDPDVVDLTEKKMIVHCFIHQANNGAEAILPATVTEAAIAWVDSEDGPISGGN